MPPLEALALDDRRADEPEGARRGRRRSPPEATSRRPSPRSASERSSVPPPAARDGRVGECVGADPRRHRLAVGRDGEIGVVAPTSEPLQRRRGTPGPRAADRTLDWMPSASAQTAVTLEAPSRPVTTLVAAALPGTACAELVQFAARPSRGRRAAPRRHTPRRSRGGGATRRRAAPIESIIPWFVIPVKRRRPTPYETARGSFLASTRGATGLPVAPQAGFLRRTRLPRRSLDQEDADLLDDELDRRWSGS